MKMFDILSMIILVAALTATVYFLYLNLPTEPVQLTITNPIANEEVISRGIQFYPNMRFPEKRISYEVSRACDQEKTSQVDEAFSRIEERTILEFYLSDNAEITISCSELAPEPKTEGHFIAGEGGPIEIINSTRFSVILRSKVALYRDEKCSRPNIATHEILHALGFDHNNRNSNSILYPTLDCAQDIDNYIIEEINRIYETESAPDLTILKVNATKSGPYLNFEIEIANQGLKNANGVSLEVYSESGLEEKFILDEIDIGTRKILKVENLKISRSAKNIRFVVDPQNGINEIDEENNELMLAVQE